MRASNLLFSLIGFFVATVNLAVGQQQTLQAVNANSFNLIQSNDTYSQEAVDVIINAFKKLPMSEIERLGVDLNDRFELGSDSRQVSQSEPPCHHLTPNAALFYSESLRLGSNRRLAKETS